MKDTEVSAAVEASAKGKDAETGSPTSPLDPEGPRTMRQKTRDLYTTSRCALRRAIAARACMHIGSLMFVARPRRARPDMAAAAPHVQQRPQGPGCPASPCKATARDVSRHASRHACLRPNPSPCTRAALALEACARRRRRWLGTERFARAQGAW